MFVFELEKAIKEGREFVMRKYKGFGEWSTPRVVSAEVAAHKSQVRTHEGYCPYSFELAWKQVQKKFKKIKKNTWQTVKSML